MNTTKTFVRARIDSALKEEAALALKAMGLSLAGGTLHRLKRSLVKASLLVIDDLGLIKASESTTYTLLEILDQQSINGSVIVTSQYPSNSWHDLFDDPTLADAILDRVIHNSYSVELRGESMRKMNSLRK